MISITFCAIAPIEEAGLEGDPLIVISPISGMSPVAAQVPAQAPSSAKPSTPAPASTQDTVTLSHAGQQAAKASADVDHDGDSH